jgi:hypothetical protein
MYVIGELTNDETSTRVLVEINLRFARIEEIISRRAVQSAARRVGKARRWIQGTLGALFAFAGLKVLTSRSLISRVLHHPRRPSGASRPSSRWRPTPPLLLHGQFPGEPQAVSGYRTRFWPPGWSVAWWATGPANSRPVSWGTTWRVPLGNQWLRRSPRQTGFLGAGAAGHVMMESWERSRNGTKAALVAVRRQVGCDVVQALGRAILG